MSQPIVARTRFGGARFRARTFCNFASAPQLIYRPPRATVVSLFGFVLCSVFCVLLGIVRNADAERSVSSSLPSPAFRIAFGGRCEKDDPLRCATPDCGRADASVFPSRKRLTDLVFRNPSTSPSPSSQPVSGGRECLRRASGRSGRGGFVPFVGVRRFGADSFHGRGVQLRVRWRGLCLALVQTFRVVYLGFRVPSLTAVASAVSGVPRAPKFGTLWDAPIFHSGGRFLPQQDAS